MDRISIEKVLRMISVVGILVCGITFLVVVLPLASIISYDIMLPPTVMDILLGMFVTVTLVLALSMVLSVKSRMRLIKPRRRQSHLVLNVFAILFLIAIPFCTATISNAYQEPNTYQPLSTFDQTNWVHFNGTAWGQSQEKVWSELNYLWGDKPEIAPLNPQVLEQTHLQGYTRLKMQISVENSGIPQWDVVPFYLLVPDTPRAYPCPVVIVHHQHNGRFEYGKMEPCGIAGDPRQAIGVDLVQRGYIVACPDALCFGERQVYFGEKYTGMLMFMLNRTLNFKYIWDVSRLIDYLVTRSDVNESRIGIMGHSLGGQMAVWCAVYDPRIKVVLSNCGIGKISGNNSIIEEGSFQNYAFYVPGIVKLNLKMEEIIGLIGNRSLFLAAGTEDHGLPINGVAEIHNWLEEKYAYYGHSNNLVTLRFVGGHMLPTDTKLRMYGFLDQEL
ncbi:MAG: dienelactone hydrolase family protein [Promethearchaeati archaeon SRVP18_Atabeyarchaeia-1]